MLQIAGIDTRKVLLTHRKLFTPYAALPTNSHVPTQWAAHLSHDREARFQRKAVAEQANTAPTTPQGGDSRQLQLYNSMSRSMELFTTRPDAGNKVSMYVCGVTVYDFSHIGHARVYVAFDVLYRILRHLGYDVDYVRNFTDIDDKIIKRAAEQSEDPLALSARFIEEFHADMDALGCLRPSREPKATEYVDSMIGTIQRCIDNGHAYTVDSDVFFDVCSLEGYGRLSGQKLDGNVAGGSDRVAVDQRKRNAADFALWKSAKPGEPTWDSPWGPGRPGWHIECSSMIRELMGPVIDIHGGGRDLVFPHHENELAQSQAAACNCDDKEHLKDGRDFVRYWVHNGFVNVDSEKMSKSLGNFFSIREVLKQYHAVALRWFLVNTQYRQPINYTQEALEVASDRVYYVMETVKATRNVLDDAAGASSSEQKAGIDYDKLESGLAAEAWHSIASSLMEDLNTPAAIAVLSEPLRSMNDLMYTKKGKKAKDRLERLAAYLALMEAAMDLFGIDITSPDQVISEMRDLALLRAGVSETSIAEAIEARAEARKSKDFATADKIREDFAAKGIGFQDAPEGTTWRPLCVHEQ